MLLALDLLHVYDLGVLCFSFRQCYIQQDLSVETELVVSCHGGVFCNIKGYWV